MKRLCSGPPNVTERYIAPISSPNEKRSGGSLPDRPARCSPAKDARLSAHDPFSCEPASERQDGNPCHNSQLYEQSGNTEYYQAMPFHRGGQASYWYGQPVSPLRAITQQPSPNVPMAVLQGQFEFVAPNWYTFSTNACGQRVVSHLVGGFCPCVPLNLLPQGGGLLGGSSEAVHQGQAPGQAEGKQSTAEQEQEEEQQHKEHKQSSQAASTHGDMALAADGAGSNHAMWVTANHLNGPMLGFAPPQYCPPHALYPPVPVANTALWPSEHQRHPSLPPPLHLPQQFSHQDIHQRQRAIAFPEPSLCNGPVPAPLHPRDGQGCLNSNAGGEAVHFKGHYYQGQRAFDGNPGPIQIPAVSGFRDVDGASQLNDLTLPI
jgi:hypothetical protein